jgi:hypothetical protein
VLAFAAANHGELPSGPDQLVGYFSTSPTPEALTEFLARPAGEFSAAALRKRLASD